MKKVAGGTTTWFWYGGNGGLVAEDSNELGQEGGVRYLSVDALGSTRLVTKGDGSVEGRMDYWPFGEEIVATTLAGNRNLVSGYGGTSQVKQKFTGKERDAETDLDYFGARYMSAAQGRFTSPDPYMPSADVKDPQSWNRYVYARNNPLRFIDPNGLDCFQGLVSCANYVIGDAGAITNALTSGVVNLPNRAFDGFAMLFTGGQRVFGDLVLDTFPPTNTDQRQGMEAANAVMLMSPLVELGAARAVSATPLPSQVRNAKPFGQIKVDSKDWGNH